LAVDPVIDQPIDPGEEDVRDTGPNDPGPIRRCVVTGERLPKQILMRFVVAPDGMIVADVEEKLPGRGLWLRARRDIVHTAVGKRLFGRAARRAVAAAPDLADRVEAMLSQRCRETVGLARRAGIAVAGFEKVSTAARSGRIAVLLAAADGAAGGRDKVRALARDLPLVDCLTGAELGAAFGRDFVAHAAVGPGRLAGRLISDAGRLAGFRGALPSRDDNGTSPSRDDNEIRAGAPGYDKRDRGALRQRGASDGLNGTGSR
jgi:predicted RNA-binding protein YlxR (DUF448 family)